MTVLHRDIESRGTIDLKKCGAWKYAGNPTTEALCVGYAVDDGPVQIWTPGNPIAEEFFIAARDPDWLVAAHNDAFESAIEERLLAPRYGWPLAPLERHRCTMATALANALPGSLNGAAAALGLPGKDKEGERLMRLMSRPRKPRKGEDPRGIYWHDSPELRRRLEAYCMRDVEIERALHGRLPPLSDAEQALWALDAVINKRGFPVDLELASVALALTRQALAAVNDEIGAITGGRVTSVNQVARLRSLLEERGHAVKGVGKRTVAGVLAHGPDADIARLLTLRQEGGKASANKLATLLGAANHGTTQFHGAATGRWSGRGFQPHNLARAQPKDSAAAIAAVLSGDLERVHAIGPPLEVIGSLSRSMICAPPGREFIGGDFSGIEVRVVAWLAGEQWLLDAFRRYDETDDAALDPYNLMAAKILGRPVTGGADRQIGKMCMLAFCFGGGVGAFKKIAPDADFSDAQIETFKQQWRAAHPAICRFWGALHRILLRAVITRTPMAHKNLGAEMRAGGLYVRLPSGRELVYPEARVVPDNAYNTSKIVFKDNAMGKWADVARSWHGLFVENVVQAVARDLLVSARRGLEQAGYPIVLHVHDEIVAEVTEGTGNPIHFARIMTALPTWAEGLPLVADVSRRQRYAEAATETVEESLPLEGPDANAPAARPAESIMESELPILAPPILAAAPQPVTREVIDKINAGLEREGIELINGGSNAGHAVENAPGGVDPDLSQGNASHPQLYSNDPERVAMASELPGSPINGADNPAGQKPKLNGRANAGYTGRSHGSSGPKQGDLVGTWIYSHPDQLNYLKVTKHVTADGDRHFYQHHWDGHRWVHGVKGTYAEQKIPYRLPELIAAPPTEPVWICEGEKDADNVAALGLIATTNPGGAKVFQTELAESFKGKQLAYILEDNDAAGREHTRKVLAALTGIVPSIGVVAFPELPEKGDVSDWLEQGGNKKLLLARAEQAFKRGAASEIIEPVDLWGQFDPPELPIGLLPGIIEQFAFEESELTGADASGFAVAALAVCAAALPDHTQLQVKRHDPYWLEAARLWVGLIGYPSAKKTPIILRATAPLKRIDAELWREFLAAKECYDELSSEERKKVERPKQRRLRLEDTTIEAAQEVLKDSPDGVLCVQDELAGWFGAMDKYAGRGAARDRAFWLQSFHGGPYAVNRIARGAGMIENLSVSLLGGIQPDPVRKIADDSVDDGLLQRLTPIVLRPGNAGTDVPTGQAAQHYDALIEQLHERLHPGAPLQFDDAALAIREKLEQKHLNLMAYEVINRKLAAHIGKYDGLFARLCLLWHCIEGTGELVVAEHTARRVADFMRHFLLPHATAFYAGMLALSDDHDRLTKVAGYILAKKLSRITNRDVQHGSRAMRGLERQEIESLFDQLEALGWLIRAPGPRWSAPPHWQVNPEVHRRFADRAEREASDRTKEREMLREMFGATRTGQ